MRYFTLTAALLTLAALTCCFSDPAACAQNGDKWGDVKGQVVWSGNGLPDVKKMTVDKDQAHCLSKGDILNEEWVVNKDNKGIRWAVVWLAPAEADGTLPVHPNLKDVPKKPALIDQPCCKFEPHVLAIREGQPVTAKNSAPIAHNFKWAGIRNRGDNKLMPPNTSFDITDLKAAPYPVIMECNIHPWMRGYIRIFDHPYFAVTDADGKFDIKNAPAGKYRIVVWQEAIGYKSDKLGDPIEIKAGGATDLGKIDLKPK